MRYGLTAGAPGLLGIDIDEEYGGGGNPDYRYYAVMGEEFDPRAGSTGAPSHSSQRHDRPYLDPARTPEQRERWLPGLLLRTS